MARTEERFTIGTNVDDTSGDLVFRSTSDVDDALYINVWRMTRKQWRCDVAHTFKSWTQTTQGFKPVPAGAHVYVMEFDACSGDWPCFATMKDAIAAARDYYSE